MTQSQNVFSKLVYVTKQQLESALVQIRRDLDEDDDSSVLEYDSVIANSKLLDYICSSMIEDGTALHDQFEFWNNDGWCDWRDYL